MEVTIATHNRPKVDRAHNLRDELRVANEPHIDPDGEHETWLDMDHRQAYEEIFGEARSEYNSKQKRNDRKINDYYEHIKKDKAKKPIYEMIVGVYNLELDRNTKKEICKEFVKEWENRNPNLKLVGVYWHADEPGQEHIHIDYIPVGTGYKKGMTIQSSLTKAFEEMGFKTKHSNCTAQMMWEQRENAALEKICNEHELLVIHPQAGRAHMEKDTYIEYVHIVKEANDKAYTIRKEAREEASVARTTAIAELTKAKDELDALSASISELEDDKKVLTEDITDLEADKNNLNDDISYLEEAKAVIKKDISELTIEAEKLHTEINEKELEDGINEILIDKVQEVLKSVETNPRIKRVEKIDTTAYKELPFDKSKVIVPKEDLELFYDFNMTATIKEAVIKEVKEIKDSFFVFISDYKKKIEDMPALQKYLDDKETKAKKMMAEAERTKKEADELKKNEEKSILKKAQEILEGLYARFDFDPDMRDRGYRALKFIRDTNQDEDFERYENKVRKKFKDMYIDLDE